MTARIAIPTEGIAAFCERWQVTEMALFGSVLRDDFGPDSDIDVLVAFKDGARHTLFNMVEMEEELKALFGRQVDLAERIGIERSRNHLRRKAVLETAETISMRHDAVAGPRGRRCYEPLARRTVPSASRASISSGR